MDNCYYTITNKITADFRPRIESIISPTLEQIATHVLSIPNNPASTQASKKDTLLTIYTTLKWLQSQSKHL